MDVPGCITLDNDAGIGNLLGLDPAIICRRQVSAVSCADRSLLRESIVRTKDYTFPDRDLRGAEDIDSRSRGCTGI